MRLIVGLARVGSDVCTSIVTMCYNSKYGEWNAITPRSSSISGRYEGESGGCDIVALGAHLGIGLEEAVVGVYHQVLRQLVLRWNFPTKCQPLDDRLDHMTINRI